MSIGPELRNITVPGRSIQTRGDSFFTSPLSHLPNILVPFLPFPFPSSSLLHRLYADRRVRASFRRLRRAFLLSTTPTTT